MKKELLVWLSFGIAILAYLMPWFAMNVGVLSMGAYDFAEFLSKAPAGIANPTIYLLLRAQLFLLTAFLALGIKKPFFTADWWLRAVLGILLVIAQLPALNMLGGIATDANRQQQVISAGLSLLSLMIGLSGLVARWGKWLQALVVLAAIGTSFYALLTSIEIMRPYGLRAEWGFGAILYWLSLGFLLVLCFFPYGRNSLSLDNYHDYAK